MYQDLGVIAKVGNEERTIPQTVGVSQGDNLSPVLFVFMMSAFAEALEYEWEKSGMRQAEFARVSQDELDNQVGSQDIKKELFLKSRKYYIWMTEPSSLIRV